MSPLLNFSIWNFECNTTMNKRMLSALLTLIPQKIQYKAVLKALNFVFPSGFFSTTEPKVIKLSLVDFNRSWVIKMNQSGFYLSKDHELLPDIIVSSELNTIIMSHDTKKLKEAVEKNHIDIKAAESDRVKVISALNSVHQRKLDQLIDHGYRFFKLTPRPRIDICTVTIDDIRISKDVDFIRDEAIKLEKTDLKEALRLMELAHSARPSGQFIEKKVREYRLALSK